MRLSWLCVYACIDGAVLADTVVRAQLAKLVHDASGGEQVSLKKFGLLLMAGQAGQLLKK